MRHDGPVIDCGEWFDHLLDNDHSHDFIIGGGSLLRIAVTDSETGHQQLKNSLEVIRQTRDMVVISVLSQIADVSNPTNIVRQIGVQLPASDFIERFLRNVWKEAGYPNDRLRPLNTVAQELDAGSISVRASFDRTLNTMLRGSDREGERPAFSRDFANALETIAAIATQEGADSSDFRASVEQFDTWLKKSVEPHIRKKLRVQWNVAHTNATQVLRSIMAFCTAASYAGCVLHLDLRSVMDQSLVKGDVRVRYTPQKILRTYQWIREIIDQTYMFQSSMIIIEVGPQFLDQRYRSNGVGMYDALKFRVIDDVRTSRQNPSAVVVRLDGNGTR